MEIWNEESVHVDSEIVIQEEAMTSSSFERQPTAILENSAVLKFYLWYFQLF